MLGLLGFKVQKGAARLTIRILGGVSAFLEVVEGVFTGFIWSEKQAAYH